MVSQIYEAVPKPIRYFSIANFMRNEKPQRGRNREFWQLNCDIFGSNSINADIEILQVALDIMLELGAPKNSFKLKVSSRAILKELFLTLKIADKEATQVARTLDKWQKLSQSAVNESLTKVGLNKEQIKGLSSFMNSKDLPKTPASTDLQFILQTLEDLGYGAYTEYDPTVIRGFDYYDGMVFELVDTHKDNNRALFGGGRYNGLANLFGAKTFPAVGFAPGDETTRLFLESWGLTKKIKEASKDIYYLPLLDNSLIEYTAKLAKTLRAQGLEVVAGLEEQKINKALDYANKKGFTRVVILGSEEFKNKVYKVKDMNKGKETKHSLK